MKLFAIVIKKLYNNFTMKDFNKIIEKTKTKNKILLINSINKFVNKKTLLEDSVFYCAYDVLDKVGDENIISNFVDNINSMLIKDSVLKKMKPIVSAYYNKKSEGELRTEELTDSLYSFEDDDIYDYSIEECHNKKETELLENKKRKELKGNIYNAFRNYLDTNKIFSNENDTSKNFLKAYLDKCEISSFRQSALYEFINNMYENNFINKTILDKNMISKSDEDVISFVKNIKDLVLFIENNDLIKDGTNLIKDGNNFQIKLNNLYQSEFLKKDFLVEKKYDETNNNDIAKLKNKNKISGIDLIKLKHENAIKQIENNSVVAKEIIDFSNKTYNSILLDKLLDSNILSDILSTNILNSDLDGGKSKNLKRECKIVQDYFLERASSISNKDKLGKKTINYVNIDNKKYEYRSKDTKIHYTSEIEKIIKSGYILGGPFLGNNDGVNFNFDALSGGVHFLTTPTDHYQNHYKDYDKKSLSSENNKDNNLFAINDKRHLSKQVEYYDNARQTYKSKNKLNYEIIINKDEELGIERDKFDLLKGLLNFNWADRLNTTSNLLSKFSEDTLNYSGTSNFEEMRTMEDSCMLLGAPISEISSIKINLDSWNLNDNDKKLYLQKIDELKKIGVDVPIIKYDGEIINIPKDYELNEISVNKECEIIKY